MKISSNQVFRYLVCENYDDDPGRFVNKFYEYKLGEAFDFDVEGLATPQIPLPGTAAWSGTTLPTLSYGYSIKETPLHIVMFYNGIANKGKLMKPYLVESIEKDGRHACERIEIRGAGRYGQETEIRQMSRCRQDRNGKDARRLYEERETGGGLSG